MMKKFYFLALVAVTFAFASCEKTTEEAAVPEAEVSLPEDAFRAQLHFDLGKETTRAFGVGATEPWEKIINTATVFVFNQSGVLIYRRDLTSVEIGTLSKNPLTITVDGGRAGQITYFAVVANRTISADIRSQTAFLNEMEGDFTLYNGTFEEVSTKAMHPDGFSMSAYTSATISTSGITSVSLILKRLVAKVEIKAEITDAFKQKYRNARIIENYFQLTCLCDKSYIIEQRGKVFTPNDNRAIHQKTSGNQCLFYIFERGIHDSDGPLKLSLACEFDMDGNDSTIDDRIYVTYYIKSLSGVGDGVFRRNEAYLVDININGIMASDVSATITLSDWAIGSTQNIEVGN